MKKKTQKAEKIERFHVSDISNENIWRGKEGNISMSEMTDEHLQSAYNFSQHRQLQYHNKTLLFSQKLDELEEEAEKRGLNLSSIDDNIEMGNFFKNRKIGKNIFKENKG